ncbi:MAG: pyruvate dehydrogenase complex dihydrolipoamide acetyltransferase [Polyangiales bacterium]
MAKIIGLPKLSPTMEEGTIVSWAKKEGDEIEIDDLLAEVETDKATMEFRSFDRGVLLKILVPEGETLAAEVPVAIIGKRGEDISALLAKASGSETEAPTTKVDASEVSSGSVESVQRSADLVDAGEESNDRDGERRTDRVLSSPLVRRMARERGIDLNDVSGSGPKGRIIKRDLESLPAKTEPRTTTSAGTVGAGFAANAFERKPPLVKKASAMRKTIARRLTESKQNVPHYYLTIDIDADPIVTTRRELNKLLEKNGEKISLNDLIIKACGVALERSPNVNASWVDGTLRYHQVVDISIAIAVPDGLVTPVLRDANRKGVLQIHHEVVDFAARAKNKKLKPEEMADGTFSISNLGMFGIEEFSAVINPPEAAILAVGALRDEPVVRSGQIVAGQRMRMTMSCDHRVIDGAVGAEFLALLRELLESPANMLL